MVWFDVVFIEDSGSWYSVLCCLDSVSVNDRAIMVVSVKVRFRSGRGQVGDIIIPFQVERWIKLSII
jgi:predicted RNase H-related nuclease YkuK (DUF458 family)